MEIEAHFGVELSPEDFDSVEDYVGRDEDNESDADYEKCSCSPAHSFPETNRRCMKNKSLIFNNQIFS